MKYNVISDSCLDFNKDVFNDDYQVERVPLKITIDGVEYNDVDKKVGNILESLNFKAKKITTAAPSPNDFIDAIKDKKDTFIITLSSKISGSYQSAVMAKDLLLEEVENTFNVHIFDSFSAATGQDLIAIKIKELMENGESFQGIIDTTTEYIAKMKTIFSLESLDTLVSNGRVNVAKQYLTKAFNLFPILRADNGKIEMSTFARGKDNALNKLIDSIGEHGKDFSDKIIGITHINATEKANYAREKIKSLYNFKDILIFEGGGLSSVYASRHGIILAF